jgi:hypothetical protein
MARKTSRKGDTALIEALARGQTVAQAARLAGVSRRTAFRRLQEPDFRDVVRKCRGEIFDSASGALAATMRRATRTLRILLDDATPTVRLGAAKAILDSAQRLHEAIEVEQRLAVLEARINAGRR